MGPMPALDLTASPAEVQDMLAHRGEWLIESARRRAERLAVIAARVAAHH
jgi:hypothetical protein